MPTPDRDDIEELTARSSLGAPGARAPIEGRVDSPEGQRELAEQETELEALPPEAFADFRCNVPHPDEDSRRTREPDHRDEHRKLTQAELVAEARERFGDEPTEWAFECPNCGDIATAADFPTHRMEAVGQECVGRYHGALAGPPNLTGRGKATRGCDWVAYGLIRGPWEIVMPDGHSAWGFPLAASTPAGRA